MENTECYKFNRVEGFATFELRVGLFDGSAELMFDKRGGARVLYLLTGDEKKFKIITEGGDVTLKSILDDDIPLATMKVRHSTTVDIYNTEHKNITLTAFLPNEAGSMYVPILHCPGFVSK